jgi:hypothetical protein
MAWVLRTTPAGPLVCVEVSVGAPPGPYTQVGVLMLPPHLAADFERRLRGERCVDCGIVLPAAKVEAGATTCEVTP